ncbi:ABC transporter permease [Carboxylicivirga sp. M1479]|uniref:ABC transporter permease n=1 Tax=Carboxylicivirga sp. M1479 TaxID=2594476 RepID=UPI001177A94F|nr:ABC transporter permease [Carboxylicivirga sp. M1479]TRX70247.1 ABC transporter permease [Carboxylicivirga sp. M1479]
MIQSLYLGLKYLQYHIYRTLILIGSIGLIIYLPLGLRKLISESERQMMARADSTPLIIGSKGNATDLVINSIYLEQSDIELIAYSKTKKLDKLGFGYSIPLISVFNARDYPIVGTTLDYFNFRGLEIASGRNLQFVGECVIGSHVADELSLAPGDSLVSSPDNFLDLAGSYPLQMKVVGVLNTSNTPDDRAVFTDLKTNWVIMGLGHGHQDMKKVTDFSLILEQDSSNITASAKLFIYNKINGEDLESFHFHGDANTFPISAVIFVPDHHKAATLLRGRYKTEAFKEQILVPSDVVRHLLENIFRIKHLFNTAFILVGLATFLILSLIIALTLRLRKKELYTMFTIGSSKTKTIEIICTELFVIVLGSISLAILLYGVTGYFVEAFIRQFIL